MDSPTATLEGPSLASHPGVLVTAHCSAGRPNAGELHAQPRRARTRRQPGPVRGDRDRSHSDGSGQEARDGGRATGILPLLSLGGTSRRPLGSRTPGRRGAGCGGPRSGWVPTLPAQLSGDPWARVRCALLRGTKGWRGPRRRGVGRGAPLLGPPDPHFSSGIPQFSGALLIAGAGWTLAKAAMGLREQGGREVRASLLPTPSSRRLTC